uniref:Uncharacterized protein n=1 Tax=Amphimedon queenslandica TaxID=400682 RepID=A0A1X7SQI0_AMPQE
MTTPGLPMVNTLALSLYENLNSSVLPPVVNRL